MVTTPVIFNFLDDKRLPLLPGEELIAERVLDGDVPSLRAFPVKDLIGNSIVENFRSSVSAHLKRYIDETLQQTLRDITTADVWSMPRYEKDIASVTEKVLSFSRLVASIGDGSYAWGYQAIRQQLAAIARIYPPLVVSGNKVTATTQEDSIIGGVNLGRFNITLGVTTSDSPEAIRIAAVTPKHPRGGDRHFHPHVTPDGRPCLGDAHSPILNCMRAGDLLEIFTIVEAHLHSYNPKSPYRKIADWGGRIDVAKCVSCGVELDPSTACKCQKCGKFLCEPCHAKSCAICEDGSCSCGTCRPKCPSCEKVFCQSCGGICSICGAPTCSACLTAQAGKCSRCLKAGR